MVRVGSFPSPRQRPRAFTRRLQPGTEQRGLSSSRFIGGEFAIAMYQSPAFMRPPVRWVGVLGLDLPTTYP